MLFPGHYHLLSTSTDDPSLAGSRAILGHQHRCLPGGYEPEMWHIGKEF